MAATALMLVQFCRIIQKQKVDRRMNKKPKKEIVEKFQTKMSIGV
jgi:hypothetical protein